MARELRFYVAVTDTLCKNAAFVALGLKCLLAACKTLVSQHASTHASAIAVTRPQGSGWTAEALLYFAKPPT